MAPLDSSCSYICRNWTSPDITDQMITRKKTFLVHYLFQRKRKNIFKSVYFQQKKYIKQIKRDL